MAFAKTKTAVASFAIAAVLLILQHQSISTLKSENQKLAEQLQAAQAALESIPTANAAPNQNSADHLELMRLRAEVTSLRKEMHQRAQAAPPAPTKPAAVPSDSPPEFVKWAETILSGPPEMQGAEGGNIRRKFLNREQLNEGEQTLLMNMVRNATELEKSPDDFSAFQSSFVASLLNWQDDPRAHRVKEIIQRAATAAQEQQMNFNAPALNGDSWPPEQKQLNRRATGAVQSLLTQEERATVFTAFRLAFPSHFRHRAKRSNRPRKNSIPVDLPRTLRRYVPMSPPRCYPDKSTFIHSQPIENPRYPLKPLRKNKRASTVLSAVSSQLQNLLTIRSRMSLIVRLLRRFIGASRNFFPLSRMLTFTTQVPAFTIFTLKNFPSPPICGLDRTKRSAIFTGSVYKRPCAGTGRRRSSTRRRRTLSLVNGKISTRNPRLENGRGFFVNLAPQPR